MDKQQALKKIEELKSFVPDIETKEKKKTLIEIKNRWTGEVKILSEKATIKLACEDNRADLRGAELCGANLYGADLCGADLSGADLIGADLSGADLSGADLCEANFGGANLYGADFSGADLYGAKFYGKGGTSKIKRSQLDDFMTALGFIIED